MRKGEDGSDTLNKSDALSLLGKGDRILLEAPESWCQARKHSQAYFKILNEINNIVTVRRPPGK